MGSPYHQGASTCIHYGIEGEGCNPLFVLILEFYVRILEFLSLAADRIQHLPTKALNLILSIGWWNT